MYGRYGDIAHMEQWQSCLSEVEITSRLVYVDDLLPEAFTGIDPIINPNLLHSRLISDKLHERGVFRLKTLIAEVTPQVLLGLSFGGFLAFEARDNLRDSALLICISSTRLRYFLPIDAPPIVNAIFGTDDQHRPLSTQPDGAGRYYHEQLIDGYGHDIYQHVDLCFPVVKNIARGLYAHKAPNLQGN